MGSCKADLIKCCLALTAALLTEPIIYINSRPFVVRQQDSPFSNLEITGIEPDEVEAMEDRLKNDVLEVCFFEVTLISGKG